MYSPIRDGIAKTMQSVRYSEAKPPSALSAFVDCFWELKTETALAEDFHLHALPDACVNILFNLIDTQIAGVTALRTRYEVLNLGRVFHYAGIQLLPGVWRGNGDALADRFVGTPYQGGLPLVDTNRRLASLGFEAQHSIMAALVQRLTDEQVITANPVTAQILGRLDEIRSVTDMAAIAGLSPRQLQRSLKQTTGFSPHDLLKVLRLQRAIRKDELAAYADQAHFIHAFRAITGYTPARYARKFDV